MGHLQIKGATLRFFSLSALGTSRLADIFPSDYDVETVEAHWFHGERGRERSGNSAVISAAHCGRKIHPGHEAVAVITRAAVDGRQGPDLNDSSEGQGQPRKPKKAPDQTGLCQRR